MDKLTIFIAVVLCGVLLGLLQRRQVKAELEERMEKAKKRPAVRRLAGRLHSEESQSEERRTTDSECSEREAG